MSITQKQAHKLKIKSHQRISPYLTECCLRASANVSYENAAKDVARYTGVFISAKTQQRLVHRCQFNEDTCAEKVSEISVDGGKVRLRTENQGESCVWRDYKAVCVHGQARVAWFLENQKLIRWVNHQPLSELLTCLGDGHSGIWNLIAKFNPQGETREILDWFHLVENLYKVGGSNRRIHQGKKLLWQGKVEETLALFSTVKKKQARNFCVYLENHRHRIVNYHYHQSQKICSIASGAVESTVKQIDRRLKISGAQWNIENVAQVLKHRCAYLNNTLLAF